MDDILFILQKTFLSPTSLMLHCLSRFKITCGINHHSQWLHLSFHLHSLTIQPRNKATIIILFATWAPQLRVSGQQYGTWNTSEPMLFLPYAENLCFPSLIQNKITVNGINLHTCCDQVSCNNIVFSLWKDWAIFLFRVCTVV